MNYFYLLVDLLTLSLIQFEGQKIYIVRSKVKSGIDKNVNSLVYAPTVDPASQLYYAVYRLIDLFNLGNFISLNRT